jgi:type II secretory pathway component PulF
MHAFEARVSHERDYFVEMIGLLVASGMPVLTALQSIRKEIRSPGMLHILKELEDHILSGSTLSYALEQSGLFRAQTIALIRIGEESGRLSQNLKLVAKQEAKDRSLRGKVRGAMMYPLLVLSLTLIIGVGISWFILPKLATVFSSLNLNPPLITKVLIAFGLFLGEWGGVVIPTVIVWLAILLYIIFFYKKTKHIGQSFLVHMPGIGPLMQQVELARLGFLVGTLLDAGVPLTEALRSLEQSTDVPWYRKLYTHLREQVEEGHAFQRAFESFPRANRLVPIPIQQLIAAGEQSGNLSGTLLTISASYEEKTEETTKNLTVLIEPVLLVIVWGGVVTVALAVILPIYNLIGGLSDATGPSSPPVEQVVSPAQQVIPEVQQLSTSTDDIADILQQSTEPVVVSREVRILETEVGFLNTRSGPGKEFTVVTTILPGTTYSVIAEEGEWVHIQLTEDMDAWVSNKYVEFITQTE